LADPLALRHFVERHPTAAAVTLDKSHRSTNRLVQLGNALGDLLASRQPLWTDGLNRDAPVGGDRRPRRASLASSVADKQPSQPSKPAALYAQDGDRTGGVRRGC
jgi:hypothetical protein